MSTRRAARAAALVGYGTPAVPPELFDAHADPWRTHPAALAWCRDHDVPVPPLLGMASTPSGRLLRVIPAYAIATGHADRRHRSFADPHWLVAVGLHAVTARCARLVLADVVAGWRAAR